MKIQKSPGGKVQTHDIDSPFEAMNNVLTPPATSFQHPITRADVPLKQRLEWINLAETHSLFKSAIAPVRIPEFG
jgi:hypothetical protein